MTRLVGQPDASPSADRAEECYTIASIEMLDAIELEALVRQPDHEAARSSIALGPWFRRLSAWWPRS
jgi:hypothetical protein